MKSASDTNRGTPLDIEVVKAFVKKAQNPKPKQVRLSFHSCASFIHLARK